MEVDLIEKALDRIRKGLEANDTKLELVNCHEGIVEVNLIFGPQSCQECVLDSSMLTKMLENVLKDVPGFTKIMLNDPRTDR